MVRKICVLFLIFMVVALNVFSELSPLEYFFTVQIDTFFDSKQADARKTEFVEMGFSPIFTINEESTFLVCFGEFEYYLEHQDELVEKYRGKFIVIKGTSVIGQYDSDIEAVEETSKQHELGTFLVQKCEPGSESYTYTFHSRVAIA